ncbi:MAG: hydrogenase maturation nickel metallochaperone HypA [Burkholderiales bacterium]|nr:hydrogenase maturation nickel metallochaperone HypA [Burkholderiales bacterium]
MHEMSLAQGIVEIVEKVSQDNNNRLVDSVTLAIGQLAGVELSALMQGLKIAANRTPMEGAEIRIKHIPGTAWCMDCGKTVPISRLGDSCPECGGYHLAVNGGTEFRVSELELKE